MDIKTLIEAFTKSRSEKELNELKEAVLKYQSTYNEIDGMEDWDGEAQGKLYDKLDEQERIIQNIFFPPHVLAFITLYNLDGYDSWEDTLEDFYDDLLNYFTKEEHES